MIRNLASQLLSLGSHPQRRLVRAGAGPAAHNVRSGRHAVTAFAVYTGLPVLTIAVSTAGLALAASIRTSADPGSNSTRTPQAGIARSRPAPSQVPPLFDRKPHFTTANDARQAPAVFVAVLPLDAGHAKNDSAAPSGTPGALFFDPASRRLLVGGLLPFTAPVSPKLVQLYWVTGRDLRQSAILPSDIAMNPVAVDFSRGEAVATAYDPSLRESREWTIPIDRSAPRSHVLEGAQPAELIDLVFLGAGGAYCQLLRPSGDVDTATPWVSLYGTGTMPDTFNLATGSWPVKLLWLPRSKELYVGYRERPNDLRSLSGHSIPMPGSANYYWQEKFRDSGIVEYFDVDDPYPLVTTRDERTVYYADPVNSKIYRIRLKDGAIQRTRTLPFHPISLAIDNDDGLLYLADWAGRRLVAMREF